MIGNGGGHMISNHAILSEKPEDQVRAGRWAQEQIEKMERNRQVGEEVWKELLPMIQKAREEKRRENVKKKAVTTKAVTVKKYQRRG